MSGYDNLISNLGKTSIKCSNLGFGEQGSILSKMPKSIFVCPNVEYAYKMKDQLDSLGRKNVLLDNFKKPFTIATFENDDDKLSLIRAIYEYNKNDAILLSTTNALFQFTTSFSNFNSNIINLSVGTSYDINKLEHELISIGYKKVESVTAPAQFARRGEIVDIFNVGQDNPIRVDFFDDEIESIVKFDSLTFEKKDKLNSFSVCPNKTYFISNEEKENALSYFEKNIKAEPAFSKLIPMLETDQDIPIEFLVPFLNKSSLLIENSNIILANSIEVLNQYSQIFNDLINKINLIFLSENVKNFYLNSINLLKINNFFNNFNKNLLFFENYDISKFDYDKFLPSQINIDFESKKLNNYINNFDDIKNDLVNLDKKIYLCLSNADTLNIVKKIMVEKNIPFTTNKNQKGIILTELKIPYNICFKNEDTWYIGSTNFAHKKQLISSKPKQIKYLPKANEYVVHAIHGIGKCEGIVTMNSQGVDKEYFKVIYRGGDVLYVPYENADSLSLYMAEGDNVTLNKLGGKEFTAQKLRATKAIEDMSKELLTLYALRKSSKGYVYPEDDYLYLEFENAFEHDETNDQLLAIQDIKKDMISGKVMDRLICGDVGFGKTEVAMRAVFKAVQAGKQVAILAPTTILSLQHYMTASKRMKDFGVNVEMLNRFKSASEQKQILEDLIDGKINVICGTHRLLSNDVKFKDLGLLVLDEEQRFGVKAKEKLKELKHNVDVLTLSATPIPRTLSMSLMTIRDISIINTPPVNRLPVKTYVISYNEDIIVSAIKDELNRGGQTLIIFNNTEQIYSFASNLKNSLKDERAHIDVAHGKMEKTVLENAIKRLYDGETNVFISTTIIENGVDLPKANTLIVIDSDKLGLSQMYQLRGRVGRSDLQAYAYFTYKSNKVLTEESSNRLQAIAEHTELGSGFKIAMRDLQIRGAGELLGKVQHGHMIKIGYDMYASLLNATIKKLKGENVVDAREIKLDIALSTKIPQEFISDESTRLQIIAKLSSIESKDELRSVLNEILGEFGKIPNELYNLSSISLLKSLAIKNKVKHMILSKTKMEIIFYDDVELKTLMDKVRKFTHFRFKNTAQPTIELSPSEFSPKTALNYTLEFFNN